MILFQTFHFRSCFRSDFRRYYHHFQVIHFEVMSHRSLFSNPSRVISEIIIDPVLLHNEIQFLFSSSDWAIQDLIQNHQVLKRYHFGLNPNVSCFVRNKLLNCPIIDFDAPKNNLLDFWSTPNWTVQSTENERNQTGRPHNYLFRRTDRYKYHLRSIYLTL